jgi:hypothetical protein
MNMIATQETLFPMPAASAHDAPSWRDNARRLGEIGHRSGGLIPQSLLHKILGVSRVRAGEICREGKVQVINFCGTLFVTGDSIEDYKNQPPFVGRGHKLNRWEKISMSLPFGLAIADAIAPD